MIGIMTLSVLPPTITCTLSLVNTMLQPSLLLGGTDQKGENQAFSPTSVLLELDKLKDIDKDSLPNFIKNGVPKAMAATTNTTYWGTTPEENCPQDEFTTKTHRTSLQ